MRAQHRTEARADQGPGAGAASMARDPDGHLLDFEPADAGSGAERRSPAQPAQPSLPTQPPQPPQPTTTSLIWITGARSV